MIEPVVARRVKLVGLDVDGTLTDGGIYLGAPTGSGGGQPVEFKRFDIQDGLGVALLKTAGIFVIIGTGRPSDAARIRAEELRADAYFKDAAAKKLPAFEAILHKYNTRWEEACFIGDDLPDLPILQRVGLPVAVANAAKEVKDVAVHTTKSHGGYGAVREFVELFFRARGEWNDVVRTYLKERGGSAVAAR